MVNLAGIKKGLSLVPSKREPQGPFSGQQQAQALVGGADNTGATVSPVVLCRIICQMLLSAIG